MNEYNFAFCGDIIYVNKYLPVLLRSLEVNNKTSENEFIYHIFTSKFGDFSEFSEKCNKAGITGKYRFYFIDNPVKDYYKDKADHFKHVSDETFLRLFIFKELRGLRLLYLDIDMIVRGNILDVFNNDYLISMAYDPWVMRKIDGEWFMRIDRHDRFNAGFLYFNGETVDGSRLTDSMLKIISQIDKYPNAINSGDQSIINQLFRDLAYPLKSKYNYCTSYLDHSLKLGRTETYEDYLSQAKDALVIHYTGANKPWKDEPCRFKEEWTKYSNDL